MATLRHPLMMILAAALTLALPQHGEYVTFEDNNALQGNLKSEVHVAKPLQESALPLVRFRRQLWGWDTDDEDYEGSAMEDEEEGFHLHPEILNTRPSGPFGGKIHLDALADCPVDDLYTCDSGDTICGVQMCDGVADCPDWDDEADCDCQEDMFLCDSVRCLDNSRMCDGIQDCADGTDEENCGDSTTVATNTTTTIATPKTAFPNITITSTPPTTTTPTTTPTTTIIPSCRNNATPRLCKDKRTYACFCDGMVECPHGEDEYRCQHGGCLPGQWRCRCDGSCIPEYAVCNRRKDCPDGSDERGCVPGIRWWKCRCRGWIKMQQRCDGRRDCRDGSDERFCPQTHHCHGSRHWLFSLSVHRRLPHLLKLFSDDDIYDVYDDDDDDDSDEDDSDEDDSDENDD